MPAAGGVRRMEPMPHHDSRLTLEAERPPTRPEGRQRIAALDVIRGFALCGILLANVQPIANVGRVVVESRPPAGLDDGHAWLGLLVEQRFFPIFAFLFGIGFSLLLASAEGRAARPRLLLLRRLLLLLAIGVAHLLLWQGDILHAYAIVGLLILLPSTWLPRWTVAILGTLLIVTALIIGDSHFVLIAGLFLAGSALTRYGVIGRMGQSATVPAVLGLVFAVAAAPFLWSQVKSLTSDQDSGASLSMSLGGLLLAGAYVCVLLVLLRTPLRPALRTVFAPLGRMALTNYLTATILVLVAARLVGGRPEDWPVTTVLLITIPVLVVQWLWSTLWLTRYRNGPIEWLWRWATWARRPPLRVAASSDRPGA
ncbi:DUF418 domain-containing protein [Micromonospora sp. NPDC052213]|uniref:DUF418 domain-containing protein n=1 Tax=Micromonospora sp. NPDC052213 TaxID=3155812 RepID=UPI0034399651